MVKQRFHALEQGGFTRTPRPADPDGKRCPRGRVGDQARQCGREVIEVKIGRILTTQRIIRQNERRLIFGMFGMFGMFGRPRLNSILPKKYQKLAPNPVGAGLTAWAPSHT